MNRYNTISKRGESKLEDVLSYGGLHARKAKFIMSILRQVKSRHGVYSLNHLWPLDDEQVMEFLSYNGVGPKTASYVVALTLNKHRFVVDTHVSIASLAFWDGGDGGQHMQRQSRLVQTLKRRYPMISSILFIRCSSYVDGSVLNSRPGPS